MKEHNPFSIAAIVCLVTPTFSANTLCEKLNRALNSFTLFKMVKFTTSQFYRMLSLTKCKLNLTLFSQKSNFTICKVGF